VCKSRTCLPGRSGRGCCVDAAAVRCSHGEYVRWRARQIAYGRWEPWADATVVRAHIRRLRSARVSYEAIASAAGVSPMTVYRIERGQRQATGRRPAGQQQERVRADVAQRLLAVTPAVVERVAARRDATGTRRRLQALIALGHPSATLARQLDVAPRAVTRIIFATTGTVSPGLHTAVCDLYERLWDVTPPERTSQGRKTAAAARALAASHGWPAPVGLDDARIDDPAYRPRAHWRPATGTSAGHPQRRGRLSTVAASPSKLSTVGSPRALSRISRCQAASTRHRPGGRL
jgi:hypothetical protein